MIETIAKLKLPGSILRIEIIDDKIYILDNKFILLVYCNKNFTLLDKHFLLNSEDDKHIYENTVAISKNLDFYHSFTKSTSGSLFKLKEDSITQSLAIDLHKRNISYSQFSHDSKLLLIGGEDGRTCFYNMDSNRSVLSLEPRSDFISSATFSNNNKLVCIGAYDKAIHIYDIDKHKLIAEVEVSDTPEDLFFCTENTTVIGITRDRKIFSYSIEFDELFYANMLFAEWPTAMISIGEHHVLVGTKGDILYILDVYDLSLVRRFRVDNFGVKSLQMKDNLLYIGYADGELKVIDTEHFHQEFAENLKLNKFAKATSLIKENIFLMTKKVAKKYDDVWDQVLDMAKELLFSKELAKAESMVKPFLWDKRKSNEFMALGSNIKDIKHFEDLVTKENYLLAFKFADAKEHLKSTKGYHTIETAFSKKFQVAKSLFSKNTDQDIQSAKNVITPYLKVESKKTLVTNLLTNYKMFTRSSRLIKSRNFKLYFRLVKNNEFLKDENIYSKIVEIGNQTYAQLLKLEQDGDYEKASQVASYLEDFIPFYEKSLKVQDIIDSKLHLQTLIATKNTPMIYKTISESTELEVSDMFTEYHQVFQGKKNEATLFANRGESPQVKETFEEHLNIDYLINSIAMVFKLSYLVEIELAMESNPQKVNVSATMERYAILFGIDNELDLLAKKLKFSHLIPDYPPNPIGFQTNDFYPNIVVKNS